VPGTTVGNAESSGSLYQSIHSTIRQCLIGGRYLLQVKGDSNPINQYFRVILPNLHYQTLQFNNVCPPLILLKQWATNPRDNELHDIEYIAFRVWWLKKYALLVIELLLCLI
jgi:hypothetical protein